MPYENPLSARERQQLATPYIDGRGYIPLSAYAPTSDTEDCWDALQAALNDAAGRVLRIDNPIGGERIYRMTDLSKGTLIAPPNIRIECDHNARLDFSGYKRTRTAVQGIDYIRFPHTVHMTRNISGSVIEGTKTLSFPTAPSLPRLGLALLTSGDLFTSKEGSIGTKSEWVWVVASTSTSVTLYGGTIDSYTTSPKLTWFNMPKVHLGGLNVDGAGILTGAGKLGDRAFRAFHPYDFRMIGGELNNCDMAGFDVVSGYKGLVQDVTVKFEALPAYDRNQYGVSLSSACEDWDVTNCTVIGGKEAFCLSNTGTSTGLFADAQGVSRNIRFTFNTARYAWRSGYCTHHGHENISWIGNIAEDCEQGLDIRIAKTIVSKNTFRRMGRFLGNLNCGIQVAAGVQQLRAEGNLYDECMRGVLSPAALVHHRPLSDLYFRGEIMRGQQTMQVGIEIDASPSDDVPDGTLLGRVTIEDCDIVTSTKPERGVTRAVRLRGKFNVPKITGRFLGGNGTGQVMEIQRATGSTLFDSGSVNLHVDIEYGSGYTAPIIAHNTGVTKTKYTGIGFSAPGE